MKCPDCRGRLRPVVFHDPQIGRVRAWVCLPCSDVLPPPDPKGPTVNRLVGYVAALALVLTVLASNAAIDRYGIVPVGFGLMAPAAVYVVGVALVLRDVVHVYAGRLAAGIAVLAGAALTLLVAPELAVASAAAYLVAETVDLLVFDRAVRRQGWTFAVVASSAAGLVLDSLVFLWLAFRSYEFLPGQLVGKAVAVALAVCALTLVRLPRRPAVPIAS